MTILGRAGPARPAALRGYSEGAGGPVPLPQKQGRAAERRRHRDPVRRHSTAENRRHLCTVKTRSGPGHALA